MADSHSNLRRALEERVLRGPGHTTSELRQAAAGSNASLPEDLRALVEKVHRHAYKITDEEIAALKQNYSDDQLFELIVAAAVGAAGQRLDAALSALSALEEAGP
jgi:hypothetical protein